MNFNYCCLPTEARVLLDEISLIASSFDGELNLFSLSLLQRQTSYHA